MIHVRLYYNLNVKTKKIVIMKITKLLRMGCIPGNTMGLKTIYSLKVYLKSHMLSFG